MLYTQTLLDLQSDVSFERSHVVILGAGASYAAFPKGDKNGKPLPVMNNFVESIDELRIFLNKNGFSENDTKDFEMFFSDIVTNEKNKFLIEKIEEIIRNYFLTLELPDTPTIYDHLLLSLREKDIIATFNWDPLLSYAARRLVKKGVTEKITRKINFLHGNVAISFDKKNRKIRPLFSNDENHNIFYNPVRLLYPIKNKNYIDDEFIKNQWDSTKNRLKQAPIPIALQDASNGECRI